jgi:hypothetical protein
MNENITVAGARPNVISSAKESICTPRGDDTLNKRATIPSKKSNTAPNTINSIALSNFPEKAITQATHPEKRLQQVIVLGICFFTDILFFI